VDKNVFRISEKESEQRLTAARPSRILTAFPFDYPENPKQHIWRPQKQKLRGLQPSYFLFKEQLADFLSDRPKVFK
jgi:hypothetical protein